MGPGRFSIQYRREAEERSLGSSSCSVCLNLKLHRRICFVLFELNENCSPSRTNESINQPKKAFLYGPVCPSTGIVRYSGVRHD
jgi:hypothetical protein